MSNKRLPRLAANTNLSIFTGSEFEGLPIMANKGPFIYQHLDRTLKTINLALNDYSRVCAIRFDLRFPNNGSHFDHSTNDIIDSFMSSLRSKVKNDRKRSAKNNNRSHNTIVRYVWDREIDTGVNPHYHFLILLNNDAYFSVGSFDPGPKKESMASRIEDAWRSALGLPYWDIRGLVQRPDNAVYHINRNQECVPDLFYRASYMCKEDTKVFGCGSHAFGASRI